MDKHASSERLSMLSWQFAVVVGGIYACFLATSLLHEGMYSARTPRGESLSPWVVNAFEALASALVGGAGVCLWEGLRPAAPQRGLAVTGGLQVLSKCAASTARVWGLPGPALTLVKTARPLPVMVGQRWIAGTRYSLLEYAQYVLIVLASMLVGGSTPKSQQGSAPALGVACLGLSMACDGYVGGRQKEMSESVRSYRRAMGVHPESLQPFEMQFYTNMYMFCVAAVVAMCSGGVSSSLALVREDPVYIRMVAQYALCSAIGQVFVFCCVTWFDPLILAVVCSSRKMLSVLLTLVVFEYEIDRQCLLGLLLALLSLSCILHAEAKKLRRRRGPND